MPVRPRHSSRSRTTGFGGISRTRIFWLTTVLVSLFIILFSDLGLLKLIKLEREKKELQRDIAILQDELKELGQEEEQLHDWEYVAKLAREKFRMVRDGEKVFRVVDRRQQAPE